MKWYEHETTKVRCRQMPAPYENIWIGSDPNDGFTIEDAQSFDTIVNVSDSVCAYLHPARPDQRMHWYPINETAYWTYTPFYVIKHVLDYHYDRKDKIYLHCHAGAWRSPSMFRFWLLSRGVSRQEIMKIHGENFEPWKFKYYWEREGEFPLKIDEFYRRYNSRERHSLYSLLVGDKTDKPLVFSTELYADKLLNRISHRNRWSWYYSIIYWIKERKRRYLAWKSGTRYVQYNKYSTDYEDISGWLKTPVGLLICLFTTPTRSRILPKHEQCDIVCDKREEGRD